MKTERKHRRSLSAWDLEGEAPEAVAERVAQLPARIRGWVGRMVWWDRYSERTQAVHGFDGWLAIRNEPEPDPAELADALVGLGYSPTLAGLRAGTKKWGGGRERGKKTATQAPPGTVFPVRIGRVTVRPVRNQTGWQGYAVQKTGLAGAKHRRSFSDFGEACQYARQLNETQT